MKKILLVILLLVPTLVQAATLKGVIYNDNLEIEQDVLVEVTTTPHQQYLAKTGQYLFTLPPGTYTLTAQKGGIVVTETIQVAAEGDYIFDIFLISGLAEEEELWKESEEELLVDERLVEGKDWLIPALIGAGVMGVAIGLLLLWKKRPVSASELPKVVEQLKEEIANEPGDLDLAISIIQKYGGRISQKELRKELLPLSEAKVSLLVTELEHKRVVEKVKRGRGNILLLKEQPTTAEQKN